MDDVSGHQVAERYLPRLAVANDGSGDVDHGLELGGSGVRTGLLPEAESHAQNHHHGHHGAGARVSGGEGYRRQSRQQNHQRIADDFQKADGPTFRLFLRHLIRTRGARPIFGLVLRQAALRGAQVPQQRVNVLAGGVEDGGRNMNLLVLGLSWNRRLVRFKHHRSSRGATNALQFDDRRFT